MLDFVQMGVSHVVMKEKPALKIILSVHKCTQTGTGTRLGTFDIKHTEALRVIGHFVGFLTIFAVVKITMNLSS